MCKKTYLMSQCIKVILPIIRNIVKVSLADIKEHNNFCQKCEWIKSYDRDEKIRLIPVLNCLVTRVNV